METIKLSNKALNYSSIEKLFNEINRIENVDKINIFISHSTKKNNIKKKEEETFSNIPDFLKALKNLKRIDSLEMKLYTNNSNINLEYTSYTECWMMTYYSENNVTKTMIYILNNTFKPNWIKSILFGNTFILWIIFGLVSWFLTSCISVIFKNVEEIPIVIQIYYHAVIILFIVLIVLSIYKIIKRKKPYINNKFWEEHKIDIVQNIIFYFLGVITPYIISWIIK